MSGSKAFRRGASGTPKDDREWLDVGLSSRPRTACQMTGITRSGHNLGPGAQMVAI